MKRLQAVMATAIIAAILIGGMLAIGIDALQNANGQSTSNSATSTILITKGIGSGSVQLEQGWS